MFIFATTSCLSHDSGETNTFFQQNDSIIHMPASKNDSATVKNIIKMISFCQSHLVNLVESKYVRTPIKLHDSSFSYHVIQSESFKSSCLIEEGFNYSYIQDTIYFLESTYPVYIGEIWNRYDSLSIRSYYEPAIGNCVDKSPYRIYVNKEPILPENPDLKDLIACWDIPQLQNIRTSNSMKDDDSFYYLTRVVIHEGHITHCEWIPIESLFENSH